MFSPQKKNGTYVMEVLANTMIIIILQYVSSQKTVHLENLHNVICQLYLNKARKKTYLLNSQNVPIGPHLI